MFKQKNSKTKLLFTERYIYSTILFIVSTVSALSISWKALETLNVLNKPWALPIIALFTGVLTFVLPALVKKSKWFCIIFETGFTLLIVQLLKAFIPHMNTLLMACITGVLAYIIADFMNLFFSYNFNIMNITRNLVISFGLSISIMFMDNSIFIIAIMMCSFALMMVCCNIRLPLDEKLDSFFEKLMESISEPKEKNENK